MAGWAASTKKVLAGGTIHSEETGAMSEQIQAGDTVCIKSGGPTMTVERLFKGVKDEPKAACQWFEGSKMMSANFSVAALRKVDVGEKDGPKFVEDFTG
jgi:uncharacterized protein YodC (DUF2158 family)